MTTTATTTLSIRDRIHCVRQLLREEDRTPALMREAEVTLVAILGNILDERLKREELYNLVELNCLNSEKRANRAKVVAKTTPAYFKLREVENAYTEVHQLIMTCRDFLRSLNEEMRLSR